MIGSYGEVRLPSGAETELCRPSPPKENVRADCHPKKTPGRWPAGKVRPTLRCSRCIGGFESWLSAPPRRMQNDRAEIEKKCRKCKSRQMQLLSAFSEKQGRKQAAVAFLGYACDMEMQQAAAGAARLDATGSYERLQRRERQ